MKIRYNNLIQKLLYFQDEVLVLLCKILYTSYWSSIFSSIMYYMFCLIFSKEHFILKQTEPAEDSSNEQLDRLQRNCQRKKLTSRWHHVHKYKIMTNGKSSTNRCSLWHTKYWVSPMSLPCGGSVEEGIIDVNELSFPSHLFFDKVLSHFKTTWFMNSLSWWHCELLII